MTPQELEQLFSPIFGTHGWQKKLAEVSGFSAHSINNYYCERRKINKPTAMYFTLIARGINEGWIKP